MLSWVVTFLIVALIAGILGFGGIAGVSIEIAKTIFFIAVVLFLISAVVGLARGPPDAPRARHRAMRLRHCFDAGANVRRKWRGLAGGHVDMKGHVLGCGR